MKNTKLTGKLSLNKELVTKLNNQQMSKINGGDIITFTSIIRCHSTIKHVTCAGGNTSNI